MVHGPVHTEERSSGTSSSLSITRGWQLRIWEDDGGAQGLNHPRVQGEARTVRALASPTRSFSAGL